MFGHPLAYFEYRLDSFAEVLGLRKKFAGATIILRVRLEPHAALVEVDNPGPPLPPDTRDHLFESLWQSRAGAPGAPKDSDSRPHFGLGLYIVRLIAEFHGGEASASSLPGDTGARFTIRLAR